MERANHGPSLVRRTLIEREGSEARGPNTLERENRTCRNCTPGTCAQNKREPFSPPRVTKRRTKTFLRILTGVFCLAAYLLSTPLAPLGTAMLAWIDGEHRVHLVNQAHGTRIILAHDNQNVRRASTHHHCLASSALVLFAQPLSDAQPDHVLSFQSGNSNSIWERLPAVAAPADTIIGDAHFEEFVSFADSPQPPALRWPESPPDPSVLTVIRSTVFLI